MGQFERGRLDDLSSTPEYHWHHVLEEETRLNEKRENPAPWQDIVYWYGCTGRETPMCKSPIIVDSHQAKLRQVMCTHMFFVIRIFYLELSWNLPGYLLKTKQTNAQKPQQLKAKKN